MTRRELAEEYGFWNHVSFYEPHPGGRAAGLDPEQRLARKDAAWKALLAACESEDEAIALFLWHTGRVHD